LLFLQLWMLCMIDCALRMFWWFQKHGIHAFKFENKICYGG
jgi:hypothetical protein